MITFLAVNSSQQNFKKVSINSNTNHLNICEIHIPPETSPYFSGDIFDNFRDDMNTFQIMVIH